MSHLRDSHTTGHSTQKYEKTNTNRETKVNSFENEEITAKK